ncbi:anion transporter [Pontibacillus halophilus JSM 076056 = DSM 19796]|uniref:Sodium-dependent dicarboxylate transporter SdcS n=1 Tax=Pontibacillus halophilus JSM 076056 = DSM 19796 TaxID=1385510 RepID=A0A0A5GI90_9BACI|nr:DASS family sodium-coupled anion symporter [Pontibacillus halophilus]KGX92956.1 anion transporter [Pontibacillus halophilus JSM 076056 = DSM 19796]
MRDSVSMLWDTMWKGHTHVIDSIRFIASGNNGGGGTPIPSSETEKGGQPGRNLNPIFTPRQKVGLVLGPLLFLLTLLFFRPSGLSMEGVAVLASTLWIATWWITEAAPIPATALLPIVLFPLTGGLEIDATTSAYGDDNIFLFLGGFVIALALERWNLHKRIALGIIAMIGTSTERIVLGFMVATGFLSMWISNTATSMMMVPIGLAIIYQVAEAVKDEEEIDTSPGEFRFGKALMLGIAYSASIGGLGTLIGTPPNTLFAGAVENLYGIQFSFGKWMLFGVPLAIVFTLISWFYLVKIAYPMKLKELPGGKSVIEKERSELGKMSKEEQVVLTVFVLTAVLWISRSFIIQPYIPGINDAVIGIGAAILLFVIPSRNFRGQFLMDWDTAKKLPWGILLLFGGGLAIASGFKESGLAEWMGQQLTVLENVPFFLILVAVITMVIFLTEITSNTATASMMFPIMGTLAMAIGVHPYSLMVAAGIAASCAFMLPVATPPNAVVFGSGYLRIPDMVRAGIWLNVAAIFVLSLAIYLLLPLVWGVDLTIFPERFLN